MTSSADSLEQICRSLLEEKGWDTDYRFAFKRIADLPFSFMAYIQSSNEWIINVLVREDIEALTDRILKTTKLSSYYTNPMQALAYFFISHERGHWSVCPFDDNGAELLEAGATDFLYTRLVGQNSINSAVSNAVNLTADIINNAALSYIDSDSKLFVDGFALAYLLQAQDLQVTKGFMGRVTWPEYFSLFVNANMAFMQSDDLLYERMSGYFTRLNAAVVKRDTAKIAKALFLDSGISERALSGAMSPEDKMIAASVLQDKSRWYQASYDLTELFFRYIHDVDPRFSQNPLNDFMKRRKNNGLPQTAPNPKTGDKSEGKDYRPKLDTPKMQEKPEPSQDEGEVPLEKYEFSDDFMNPEGLEEQSTDENAGHGDAGDETESIFGGGEIEEDAKDGFHYGKLNLPPAKAPLPILDRLMQVPEDLLKFLKGQIGLDRPDFETLDSFYRRKAAPLVFKIEDPSKKSPQFEARYLARKPADPKHVRPSRIDWSRTQVHGSGNDARVKLYEKATPLMLDIPAAAAPKGIPDLLWIVDSSFSMRWDSELGAGEYDTVCRVVYSTHMSLAKTRKGVNMSYALINYAGKTTSTDWVPWAKLDVIHRELFRYKGFGTALDPLAIKKKADEAGDSFVALMVTDGGFNYMDNESKVLNEISSLTSRGNLFALFQIGEHSSFSDRIEEAGGRVFYIRSTKDLYNLTVELSKKVWGAR